MIDLDILPARVLYYLKYPRRLYYRIESRAYYISHGDMPWLTRDSIRFLEKCDMKKWVCFEWGSGRSTIYFAMRASKVVSVESNPVWHSRVVRRLRRRGLTNVELRLVPIECEGVSTAFEDSIRECDDEVFDCVLVDGIARRNECIRAAITRVKPGGVLILDDSERGYDVADLRSWSSTITSNGISSTTIWRKPWR